MTLDEFKARFHAGQRVRITQTIDRRAGNWLTTVEGQIEALDLQKTGSWFAHSQDDLFWLLRLRLRKDDGELTLINVDGATRIEVLSDAAPIAR